MYIVIPRMNGWMNASGVDLSCWECWIFVVNLVIQFRVVPFAKFEYFLEKDHSGTIPKLRVPDEQISSIHLAGMNVLSGVRVR